MALVIEREKDKDKDNSEDCDVKMGGDENKDGDKMETEGDRKKDNVFRSNADTLKKPMLKGVSVLRFAAITQLTSEIDKLWPCGEAGRKRKYVQSCEDVMIQGARTPLEYFDKVTDALVQCRHEATRVAVSHYHACRHAAAAGRCMPEHPMTGRVGYACCSSHDPPLHLPDGTGKGQGKKDGKRVAMTGEGEEGKEEEVEGEKERNGNVKRDGDMDIDDEYMTRLYDDIKRIEGKEDSGDQGSDSGGHNEEAEEKEGEKEEIEGGDGRVLPRRRRRTQRELERSKKQKEDKKPSTENTTNENGNMNEAETKTEIVDEMNTGLLYFSQQPIDPIAITSRADIGEGEGGVLGSVIDDIFPALNEDANMASLYPTDFLCLRGLHMGLGCATGGSGTGTGSGTRSEENEGKREGQNEEVLDIVDFDKVMQSLPRCISE